MGAYYFSEFTGQIGQSQNITLWFSRTEGVGYDYSTHHSIACSVWPEPFHRSTDRSGLAIGKCPAI